MTIEHLFAYGWAMEADRDGAGTEAVVEIATALDALAVQAESLLVGLYDTLETRRNTSAVRMDVGTARELCLASARLRHAISAVDVLAAGVADESRLCLDDAERTTRMWLARHGAMSHRDAGTVCRATVAIERFPTMGDALIDGEIRLGHLDAVAGIIPARLCGVGLADAIDTVRDLLPVIIETARRMTIDEFATFCARLRDRLDLDGAPDRASEPSRVWLSKLFNGRWALTGDLSTDDGALLATILQECVHRQHHTERDTNQPAAPGDGPAPDTAAVDDEGRRVFPSERTATALCDLALAGSGASRPGQIGVYLHIDLDNLGLDNLDLDNLDLVDGERDTAHTEANYDISDATLWALLAGAQITPVLNHNGNPLSYGHTRRLAPMTLRHVLAHRDRVCVFPGCLTPSSRSDIHHIQHWEHGGSTNPANCAPVCRFNHTAHHNHRWGLTGTIDTRQPDHGLSFTRPDGTPHTTDARWRHRHRQREQADHDNILHRLDQHRPARNRLAQMT